MNNNLKAQLLIIGDSFVGKTSILTRFIEDKFSANYLATVGLDFFSKDLEINNNKIKLKIWDTAGQERFRSFTHNFFRNADGILLTFDVTNEESFDNLRFWIQSIKNHTNEENIPIVVLGNKVDAERKISKQEALNFCNEINVKYFDTSAKSGEGIVESITELVQQIINIKQISSSNNNNANSVNEGGLQEQRTFRLDEYKEEEQQPQKINTNNKTAKKKKKKECC